MGSTNYQASDYAAWESAGLKDFGDYSDSVEYRNEWPSDFGDSAGEWFYADDGTLTIYSGTYANDHSPGASHYTSADVYDDRSEYLADAKKWSDKPEIDPDYEEPEEEYDEEGNQLD
jgi:hypothetical protein